MRRTHMKHNYNTRTERTDTEIMIDVKKRARWMREVYDKRMNWENTLG